MFQLIYTSAPRLLEAGKTGFGTVARSREMPSPLVSYLERLSTFDRSAGIPELQFYSIFRMGAIRYRVISRVADCGADYTRRTNHIAHHMAIPMDSEEERALMESTPAGTMLALQGLFRNSWQEAPCWLPQVPLPAILPMDAYGCWQALTGQAGCERWLGSARYSGACCLLFREAQETRRLLEFLHDGQLSTFDHGWERGFSTASVGNLSSTVFPLVCLEGKQRQAGVLPKAGLPCLEVAPGLEAPVETDVPSQPLACAPLPDIAPTAFDAPTPAEAEPTSVPLHNFPTDATPPRCPAPKPAKAHESTNRNNLYIAVVIAVVLLLLAYSQTASEDKTPKAPRPSPPAASPAPQAPKGGEQKTPETQPGKKATPPSQEAQTSKAPAKQAQAPAQQPTMEAGNGEDTPTEAAPSSPSVTDDAAKTASPAPTTPIPSPPADSPAPQAPKSGEQKTPEAQPEKEATPPIHEEQTSNAPAEQAQPPAQQLRQEAGQNDAEHTTPPGTDAASESHPRPTAPLAPKASETKPPGAETTEKESRQEAQPEPPPAPPTEYEVTPCHIEVDIDEKNEKFSIKLQFQFSAQELRNHFQLPNADLWNREKEINGTETRSKKNEEFFPKSLLGKKATAQEDQKDYAKRTKDFSPPKQRHLAELKIKEKLSKEEEEERNHLLAEEKAFRAAEQKAGLSERAYQETLEKEKKTLREKYKQSRIKIILGNTPGGGVYPVSISYDIP